MKRNSTLYYIVLSIAALLLIIVLPVAFLSVRQGRSDVAVTVLICALCFAAGVIIVWAAVHVYNADKLRYVKVNKVKKVLRETQTQLKEYSRASLSQQDIIHALADDFQCVYLVDLVSNRFETVSVTAEFASMGIPAAGEDFFGEAVVQAIRLVYPQDTRYFTETFSKENIIKALSESASFTISNRFMYAGEPVYFLTKVVKGIASADTAIIGVRNIDRRMRREAEQLAALEKLLQKEGVYKEAILTNAAGYFEVNLSKDLIIGDIFYYNRSGAMVTLDKPMLPRPLAYETLRQWWCKKTPPADSAAYERFTDRAQLISRFENGERQVESTVRAEGLWDEPKELKQTYYLTRDESNGDVTAICILYDLTKEQQLKALREELRNSRIKNSVSQMQPHFLYNALGSIREIVLFDPEYASELIYDFTTHLRACVRALSTDDAIPFTQELENIRAYVRIEQMRFGDKLRVEYDIGAEDFSIIPLTIQPIVENAIRHGIYERGARGGTVRLCTADDGKDLIITVADDGVGFDVEETFRAIRTGEQESAGLSNLTFRLEKMMNAEVTIESTVGVGTNVTIRIPKEGKTDESDHS